MKFAYARTGGPLLNWSGPTPPSPSRAGESRQLGSSDVPRAGAPEIISGYESPQPGAATIHLGGFIPEGSVRNYGSTMLADTAAPTIDIAGLARKAGIIASAYHGVKRNNGSIMSGVLWAFAAWAVFPFYGAIVPSIAVAQGFAQPKLKSNPVPRFINALFGGKRRRKPKRNPARKRKPFRRGTRPRGKTRTKAARPGALRRRQAELSEWLAKQPRDSQGRLYNPPRRRRKRK